MTQSNPTHLVHVQWDYILHRTASAPWAEVSELVGDKQDKELSNLMSSPTPWHLLHLFESALMWVGSAKEVGDEYIFSMDQNSFWHI